MLMRRLLAVINRKSGGTELEKQSDKFEFMAAQAGEVVCDDDAVSDEQEHEFRSFHLFERIAGLEQRFKEHEEGTFFL
jgi:hypothetical protein